VSGRSISGDRTGAGCHGNWKLSSRQQAEESFVYKLLILIYKKELILSLIIHRQQYAGFSGVHPLSEGSLGIGTRPVSNFRHTVKYIYLAFNPELLVRFA
jgi:hypothetical protein